MRKLFQGLRIRYRLIGACSKQITQRDIGEFGTIALENYRDPDKPKGIKTNLRDLDKMTGGLFRGELSILGGRPSAGKTVVATPFAVNVAKSGQGVLYLSLEMDGEAIAQRVLTGECFSGGNTSCPNANLVVNTDADQIIIANAGPHVAGDLPPITYLSGGLERPDIRQAVCEILEGGEHAFRERARRLRVRLDR